MSLSLSVSVITANRKDSLKRCLDAVLKQSILLKEIIVVDNASKDGTLLMLKKEYPGCRIIENKKNLGPSRARNQGIKESEGDLILCLDDDVILDRDYCMEAANIFKKNKKIGSIQGKILQYDLFGNQLQKKGTIDTAGFKIFKSRRLIDIGRGEKDAGQYDKTKEIFAANSVAVVFRKKALEDIKISNEYFDEVFFKVAEDPDIGWRLRLFGWHNFYEPKALAWHNSHSSKKLSKGHLDFIRHRKTQPLLLRKLDWRNQHLMFVKNDLWPLVMRDFLFIFWREVKMFCYLLFFEPRNLKALFEFFRLLPKTLRKRKAIMKRRCVKAREIQKWFY